MISTTHDNLIRCLTLGDRTLLDDVEVESLFLSEPVSRRSSVLTLSNAMSNHSFSSVCRRDVLRSVVLGGLLGLVGCSDSGSVQTVTNPSKATGTRAKLDKYKESAENAAKKNKRSN